MSYTKTVQLLAVGAKKIGSNHVRTSLTTTAQQTRDKNNLISMHTDNSAEYRD